MDAFKTNGKRLIDAGTGSIGIGVGAKAVPAAGTVTSPPIIGLGGVRSLVAEIALVFGSGGTSCDVYIQTSLDGGNSWIDIMQFHGLAANKTTVNKIDIATAVAAAYVPTDGSLTADTIKDGIFGDRVRAKAVIVGPYAASTLRIDLCAHA